MKPKKKFSKDFVCPEQLYNICASRLGLQRTLIFSTEDLDQQGIETYLGLPRIKFQSENVCEKKSLMEPII